MTYEEKIQKAVKNRESRSLDLAKKYDMVRSMFINIYGEDLVSAIKRIDVPSWNNRDEVKAAAKIRSEFENARKESEKMYDEEIKKAKEEEKDEINYILDSLTDDWFEDDDDEDWFDDDEEDEEDELEAI